MFYSTLTLYIWYRTYRLHVLVAGEPLVELGADQLELPDHNNQLLIVENKKEKINFFTPTKN